MLCALLDTTNNIALYCAATAAGATAQLEGFRADLTRRLEQLVKCKDEFQTMAGMLCI